MDEIKIIPSENMVNPSNDKYITSEVKGNISDYKQIASEDNKVSDNKKVIESINDLKGRISQYTLKKGLVDLPYKFDENQDWECINSSNPFEVLYLDYKQFQIITPEIVQNNFSVLEKYWKEKVLLFNTSGNRINIKKKFGEDTIENSLHKLKISYDKLSTKSGIENYFIELNKKRLTEGENKLKDSIEDMLIDGVAERSEIELRLERGLRYDLTEDEIVSIIKSAIDLANLKPYGTVKGDKLKDQLLSATWMSEKKLEHQLEIDLEPSRRGREIFLNCYAYKVEDIGEVLFSDEKQAKEYISHALIVNAIDYFSVPKAKRVKEIIESKKSEHIKYLEICYFLNPLLPYKFENENISNIRDLSYALFLNTITGKKHLTQGFIEVWLQETQKESHQILLKIIKTAENIDLAFLELIYTFYPELPYRLNASISVKSPRQLCLEIDKDKVTWESGKISLYNKSIIVWLNTIGQTPITNQWETIKDKYLQNKDAGLERFLHILNDKLEYPLIYIDKKSFSFPKIQSGDYIVDGFSLTNKTRGYIDGNIALSKKLDGVSMSSDSFFVNVATGESTSNIKLAIKSDRLKKGVDYKLDIHIYPSISESISIPISFKLVFPIKAFRIELLKYTLLFAFLGGVFRAIWTIFGFKEWIKVDYPYYLSRLDIGWQPKPDIYFFPLIFLLMVVFIVILIKKWSVVKFIMSTNLRKNAKRS